MLVAYRMNGEMLYPENGYPVGMVIPGWEANMWVKWLRGSRSATSLGTIARKPRNTPTCWRTDGPALHLRHGRKIRHHQPEPASAQSQVGLRGVRAGVVGAAGSHASTCRSTAAATGARQIDGPARDKALTRFYYELDWDGRELCCSRAPWTRPATCSRPERAAQVRGVNSIYHNNGIQTWHVHKNGEVENVEVS